MDVKLEFALRYSNLFYFYYFYKFYYHLTPTRYIHDKGARSRSYTEGRQ